jgi:hypothetical protein
LADAFIGVKGLVGDQAIGLHIRQKFVGADEIMGFATSLMETNRIAQRINRGVDLGAQSAARAPDGLILAVFFWASALC